MYLWQVGFILVEAKIFPQVSMLPYLLPQDIVDVQSDKRIEKIKLVHVGKLAAIH